MKVLFFSTQDFEKDFLQIANKSKHQTDFTEQRLNIDTVELAAGYDAVALFSIDDASSEVISKLHSLGVKYITLRSVGFDHIDLKKAWELNIKVANVPEYSPNSIAEHTIALILGLNRKLIQADKQVHRYNFKIDNLIGFDLNKKVVGIIGTGNIGAVTAKILHGFGSKIIASDIKENEYLKKQYSVNYVNPDDLFQQADIIILNCSLNESSRHLINKKSIASMKTGVMLINTARGAVINTPDVLEGLKSKKIAALGMDVYENEKGLFYKDLSSNPFSDKLLDQLLQMENVIITAHQAFLTTEAIEAIENTTISNLDAWQAGEKLKNEL